MCILKGALLGLGIFIIGSILYLITMVETGTANTTGTTAIQAWTLQNPLYWLALILCVAIGQFIFWRRDRTPTQS
jgi:cell division protein FtsX